MTSHQALRSLVTDKASLPIWLKAGYTKQQRSQFKYRLERDQLSLDKVEEILTRCGCKVVQEQLWKAPRRKKLVKPIQIKSNDKS